MQKAELLKPEIEKMFQKKLEKSYQFLKLSREMDDMIQKADPEVFSLLLDQRNTLISVMEDLSHTINVLFQEYKRAQQAHSVSRVEDLSEGIKKSIKEIRLNLKESLEIDERIRSLILS